MNEAKLLSDLEAANLGFDLVFQVTYQVSNTDADLVVVINRSQLEPLDYDYLKPKILAIIEKSGLSESTTIYFYSRILGEEEPDWQDQVLIPKPSVLEPQLDSAKADVKTSEAIADQEEDKIPKDITEYRFGLSDYLIETISEPPESDIAEIVIAFDQLSQTNKYILLTALEQFFVNQDRHAFVGLSSELRDLTQKIKKLNKRKQRLASIWIARYCLRGEEILVMIGHVQEKKATFQVELKNSKNLGGLAVKTFNSEYTNTRVSRRSSVPNRVSDQKTNDAPANKLIMLLVDITTPILEFFVDALTPK